MLLYLGYTREANLASRDNSTFTKILGLRIKKAPSTGLGARLGVQRRRPHGEKHDDASCRDHPLHLVLPGVRRFPFAPPVTVPWPWAAYLPTQGAGAYPLPRVRGEARTGRQPLAAVSALRDY